MGVDEKGGQGGNRDTSLEGSEKGSPDVSDSSEDDTDLDAEEGQQVDDVKSADDAFDLVEASKVLGNGSDVGKDPNEAKKVLAPKPSGETGGKGRGEAHSDQLSSQVSSLDIGALCISPSSVVISSVRAGPVSSMNPVGKLGGPALTGNQADDLRGEKLWNYIKTLTKKVETMEPQQAADRALNEERRATVEKDRITNQDELKRVEGTLAGVLEALDDERLLRRKVEVALGKALDQLEALAKDRQAPEVLASFHALEKKTVNGVARNQAVKSVQASASSSSRSSSSVSRQSFSSAVSSARSKMGISTDASDINDTALEQVLAEHKEECKKQSQESGSGYIPP